MISMLLRRYGKKAEMIRLFQDSGESDAIVESSEL